MTRHHHLSPDDWADALDGGGRAGAHLDACPACRAELAALRQLVDGARAAGDVPEPSPLFWNAFSARVREAVDSEPVPSRWWAAYWRPVAAMASVLATVVIVLSSQPVRGPVTGDASEARQAAYGEPIIVWSLIEQVVAPMPIDAVAEAGILPSDEITAAALDDLTPSEVDTLRRLLHAELSGLAQ